MRRVLTWIATDARRPIVSAGFVLGFATLAVASIAPYTSFAAAERNATRLLDSVLQPCATRADQDACRREILDTALAEPRAEMAPATMLRRRARTMATAGAPIALFLGAAILGSDLARGLFSWHAIFARSRTRALLRKLGSAAGLAVLFAGATLLSSILVDAVLLRSLSVEPGHAPPGEWMRALSESGISMGIAACFAAVGAAWGAILRSPLGGFALSGLLLVGDLLLSIAVAAFRPASATFAVSSMLDRIGMRIPDGALWKLPRDAIDCPQQFCPAVLATPLASWQAAGTLFAWTAIPILIALAIRGRGDIRGDR